MPTHFQAASRKQLFTEVRNSWLMEESSESQGTDSDDEDESIIASKKYSIRRLRRVCGKVINDERIQRMIIVMICINAAMMGIATYDIVKKNPKVNFAFEQTDFAFLIVFTIETFMQLVYHGIYLFKDGWLFFDFVVVVISWLFGFLQIIRAFRTFRTLRLIGRVRSLRNILTALMNVLPRMVHIFFFLVIIFYIYGVLFTSLYKDMWEQGLTTENFFSRLDYTTFTLFQIMCLDDWSQVAREVMATYTSAWIPFITFILLATFMIFNLIMAVLCDAIHEMTMLNKKRRKKKERKERKERKEVASKKHTLENQVNDISEMLSKVLHSQEQMLQYIHKRKQMEQKMNKKIAKIESFSF